MKTTLTVVEGIGRTNTSAEPYVPAQHDEMGVHAALRLSRLMVKLEEFAGQPTLTDAQKVGFAWLAEAARLVAPTLARVSESGRMKMAEYSNKASQGPQKVSEGAREAEKRDARQAPEIYRSEAEKTLRYVRLTLRIMWLMRMPSMTQNEHRILLWLLACREHLRLY